VELGDGEQRRICVRGVLGLGTMKSSGEHRRGRSMGSSPAPPLVRPEQKDEDLSLFNEMKRREKHNFLYPAPDDLDATLCMFLFLPCPCISVNCKVRHSIICSALSVGKSSGVQPEARFSL
jgi:hypothetical protein